jgi:hypothetical protein
MMVREGVRVVCMRDLAGILDGGDLWETRIDAMLREPEVEIGSELAQSRAIEVAKVVAGANGAGRVLDGVVGTHQHGGIRIVPVQKLGR